jgi:hypothetical protein
VAERDIKPFTAEEIAISRKALTADCFDYQAEEEARWVVTLDQERARAEKAERELERLRAAVREQQAAAAAWRPLDKVARARLEAANRVLTSLVPPAREASGG